MFQNIGLPFWKLLTYAFQIAMYKDFSLFNVAFKRRNCPFATSASAANIIDSDTDIFSGRSVSVNMIGYYMIFLLHNSDTV